VLKGIVLSENTEVIPNATIRVVNENVGTTTNLDGRFELKLPEGYHRISVSYTGYQTELFDAVLDKDLSTTVFLKIDQKMLEEVVVKVKKKDYSYEVIQNVIENKSKILDQFDNFKAKVYIKSVEKVEKKQKNKVEENIEEPASPKKDSIPNLNIFECSLWLHKDKNNRIKEEKEAVKIIGDQTTLFFKTVSDGEFNLYKNHQKISKISDNEIVSPLSDLTFLNYKFELLEYYFEGVQKIYKIKVVPRNLGNALYQGILEIVEDEWVIKKADLSLNKRALLRYDYFEFSQDFQKINERWLPTKINYKWKLKEGSVKKVGETMVNYSEIEFDLRLAKRFFGDEVGVTLENAYKKDSSYWENIRPEPLSKEEVLVVKEKERLELLMNSKAYLDSLDGVFNKITLPKLVYLGMGKTNRSRKETWTFDPILVLINPFALGGIRVRYGTTYYKRFENRKQFSVNNNLSYGFRNSDLRGNININYFYNPFKNANFHVGIGSDFGVVNGAATLNDLLRRSNFYQQKFLSVYHRSELFNGFFLKMSTYYEKREDLSNFKFTALGDRLITENNLLPFPSSHLYKTGISIEYTPKQLYLREPNQKQILGSKFPTFTLSLDNAWGLSQKNTSNFTFLSGSIHQNFSVGTLGLSEYRIVAGKFLDTTQLAVMDYKYIRGGDNYFFSPAMYTYQLIPQTFPVFDWFIESHYVHQFNGFFTSKVPLLNKTKIREVAGGGFLYVPEKKYQYSEIFFGLNRVFKIGRDFIRIGGYYVVGQSNDFGIRNGFKISVEAYNRNRNTWSF
jgi:hypothetical protein